jgi:putative endonuclease
MKSQTDLPSDRLHYGLGMEEQGARWLTDQFPFFRLVTKNYRWKGGELDLVFEAMPENGQCELIFVEVRARKKDALVDGVASVTLPKQRRLERTIRHFLARYRGPAKSLRFDVLAWNGSIWTHLKNVRLEGGHFRHYHRT